MEDNKKIQNTTDNNVSSDVIKLDERISALEAYEKRQRIISIALTVAKYTFLSLMALIVIFPFYWMLISSLKSVDEIELTGTAITLFPTQIIWENFKLAMTTSSTNLLFSRALTNTIIVGVVSTIGTLITTILAAFAFSRLEFKGKELVFSIFLATMMIPGEMLVITNYITVAKLGWINSYQVLIVPFMVSVFYIFLLRQNFKQIPDELYYAAKVDGTSNFKYLYRIMIPLAFPTIITIGILNLMGAWNSYIWPNLVQNKEEWRLISNWVRTAFTDVMEGRTQMHLQMAASTIVTAPLLLVYVFCRKFIMQGVSRSGIKG